MEDYYWIGKKIKDLRLSKDLTQKDLVKDLPITQPELSKIEKGVVIPNSSTLYSIAKKFGVNIRFFFSRSTITQEEYIRETCSQIRRMVRIDHFKEVYKIVKLEKRSPLFNEINHYKAFILWHEGICEYEVNGNTEKALNILNSALFLERESKVYWSENEIGMFNSIGAIHYKEQNYQLAYVNFFSCIQYLTELPDKHLFTNLHIRVLYNLAKCETKLHEFQTSITHCLEAIDICRKNETLYLLPELYSQTARNYEEQGKMEKSLPYIKKARILLEFQGHADFLDIIDRQYHRVQKKIREQNST